MSDGGFAVNPFKIKAEALDYLRKGTPVMKALGQYGGIAFEIDGRWFHLPFTMLTFPG